MSVHDIQTTPSRANTASWLSHQHRLIEFLPVAIYACDIEGRILWYNSRAAALWGRTPHIGKDGERFCGSYKVYIDGRELSREYMPIAQVLSSGEPIDGVEALVERPDGSRVWAMVHVEPVRDEEGRTVGAINCFHETIGLQQANEELRRRHEELQNVRDELAERERYFREMLDSLPTAVYMTDAEGRITYYNKAAVELSGRTPEVGSDRWCITWRLYRPDGTPLPLDECPMAMALKEGRAIRDAEVIAERPDGARIPIIPYPTPLHDSAGRVVGAVNVLVDVSERRDSETQKQLLLDELNHRIKNKVQMLHSLLRIAMDRTSSSEARSVLNEVARRVAAIAAAQRVLYDASSPYSFDVRELVTSVCTDARRSFGEDVSIEHEADAGRLGNSSAMPVALILSELLTNAVKYGADDRGAVSIRVQLRNSGDAHVLVVEDDGPGFGFERIKSHSSGLGLVTGLARQLGGSFEVRRATGAQCVVTFPKRGEPYNHDNVQLELR